MAPKAKRSTAKVASKKPCRMIDLETKLKVASQELILKIKNKMTEAVTGSASLKATRLTIIREGSISDM
jgi:predicted metal-binding transcription factor (methanogenesis marker protein 9)